jgi:Ca2+-binding RTX toxin-like protein
MPGGPSCQPGCGAIDMANITGTQFNDTIHKAGDGVPVGGTEFNTVTDSADTIDAGAGNDGIYGRGGDDVITAGTGDDYAEGNAGNDTINGGDGNDTILGGQGTDKLTGGTGNDNFYFEGVSDISGLAETIDGGNDIDTMDFAARGAFGAVNLSKATITGVERLFLNSNDVTLTAAQLSAFETISAGSNPDRLFLSAAGAVDLTGASIFGIDEFRGTSGVDSFIFSGVSNGQTVNTLAGADTVTGSEGNDAINSGADADVVKAGAGNDSLTGETGNDKLYGEDGNDILNGGVGVDAMGGSAGNDIFRVSFVADISGLAETLSGGTDTDQLDFSTLNAQGAVDLTKATISSVEMLSLNFNDVTLTAAQLGAFTMLTAGSNPDRLILAAAGTADLTDASIFGIDEFRGSSGNDVITINGVTNAQFIDGRAGNDTITGGYGADKLWGDIGTDTINGGDGDDIILGGQGADVLSGGVGYDVFQIDQISDIDGLVETINGGNDLDRLDFSTLGAVGAVDITAAKITSVEQLWLNSNDVTLTTAQLDAFETISAGSNPERLILSNAGTTNLTGASIVGIDEIRGTSGADTINLTNVATGQNVTGQAGNDTIYGGAGGDTLSGNDGNDVLFGRDGNDVLFGGLGRDGLAGGFGDDVFLYTNVLDSVPGVDNDKITDFVHGEDTINLVGVDANVNLAGDQAFSFVGAAAFKGVAGELRYSGGIVYGDLDGNKSVDFQITLTGAPTLTADDFVL